MAHYAQEERHIREENLRLQRKLQMEMERRESLCRHLSESESSLEMDDERYVLYKNIDLTLRNKLHGPVHYQIGVTCVYNEHMVYTLFVITRQSNPQILKFHRQCHEFTSVWAMFPCNRLVLA